MAEYELPETIQPVNAIVALEELATFLVTDLLVDTATAEKLIAAVNGKQYSTVWKTPDIQTMISQVAAKRERAPGVKKKSRRLPSLAAKLGELKRIGFAQDDIETAVQRENNSLCAPPLDKKQMSWLFDTAWKLDPDIEDTRPTVDDQGNAERFLAFCGDIVRFCPERRGWYIYQEKRGAWKFDDQDEVRAFALNTVIQMEALDILAATICGWPFLRKSEKSQPWFEASRDMNSIEAMLQMASLDNDIRRSLDVFDVNRELLATPGGILNLRTGSITPNSADAYLTRMTKVAYDPNAKDTVFDGFLKDATKGNDDLANFLQRAMGYSLSGNVIEDKIFFLYGPGGGGKSTLLNACVNALGTGSDATTGYGQTTPTSILLKGTSDTEKRLSLADLIGVRLAVAAEVDQGVFFNVALLKNISGGEEVPARNHYKGYFRYRPAFTLWLTSNYQPHAPAQDTGFWRRMIVIPFVNAIAEEEQDKTMRNHLLDDPNALAAIFKWMVDGYRAYRQHGLNIPTCVKTTMVKYRENEDTFAGYIDEMLEPGKGAVLRSDVRESYKTWCQKYAMGKPMLPGAMNAQLEQAGFKKRQIHRRNGKKDEKFNIWEGINRVGVFVRNSWGDNLWEITWRGTPHSEEGEAPHSEKNILSDNKYPDFGNILN